MDIGRVGVWTTQLDLQPAEEARRAAARFEELGFSALWVGEAVRREAFANASLLLAATEKMVVATGIANIWARDALTMAAGQKTLAEAFPDRFLLGIGVSHAPLLETRGHDYGRPLQTMREYLDAMDRAPYHSVAPRNEPGRVLAALGPKMLELARERADGAHTYFVPVAHTEAARAVLGRGKLLVPEQAAVLETDPGRARALARRHTTSYLRLNNYTRNLERLGFGPQDLEGGGSDALVDAVVAWGDPAAVADRVEAHLEAGADHVCVQLLVEDPAAIDWSGWEALAEALAPI